jgi:DNA topoisomerase-1
MPRYLVIVESPAKARILSRFLGDDYLVEASIGHVRDLPESAKQIPESVKKEPWARLGVNVDEGFEPLYVVSAEKKKQVKKLKDMLKQVEHLYLATDEDREGESISWHLLELLRPKVPHERLVYHEITKTAIQKALSEAREIDMNLVRAQEARRIVDRLYGYAVSPLLWKKIKPQLSAGRVQSVAVRLVVEREEERIRFKPAVFWDLEAKFQAKEGSEEEREPFEATLQRLGEKKVATGKDFDPETGLLKKGDKPDAPLWLDADAAQDLHERLKAATPQVLSIEEKPYTERPGPPFTTSTLQQAANGRFRYAARRTMDLAQRLYENGFITYMRTDSVTLSQEALHAAREEIRSQYGDAFVPEKPRFYKGKVKNAQEAHEAIRPAGSQFTAPAAVGKQLGQDAQKLYELIYQRTLACQMPDARGQRMRVEIGLEEAVFACGGKTVEFPGFQRAYRRTEENENKLPQLREGQELRTHELDPKEHRTQPPARLSEASLVKELEARGIGRPSTYASIIETILRRGYVRKQGTALIPSYTAFAVTKLMRQYLGDLVDYSFTAAMEDELDQISLGQLDQKAYLSRFYHGNGQPGLQQRLQSVEGEIDPREVCGPAARQRARRRARRGAHRPLWAFRVEGRDPAEHPRRNGAGRVHAEARARLHREGGAGPARHRSAPRDGSADLRQERPLRALCPARRPGRRWR